MIQLRALTLFCSASSELDPCYGQEVEPLMHYLARHDIELIYGGSRSGLMGVIADQVLSQGGRVRGVLPEVLNTQELVHTGLTELEVVPDMMERKKRLLELGDVIVTLPGGLGTLDELLEAMTWNYVNLLDKPIVLLNLHGFWDPFVQLLQHLETHHVLHPGALRRFHVLSSTEDLLEWLHQLNK